MRTPFALFLLLSTLSFLCLSAIPFGMQVDGFQYKTDHFWNKKARLRPAHNRLHFTGVSLWLSATPLPKLQLDLTAAWQNAEESLNGTTRGLSDIELSGSSLLYRDCRNAFFAQGVLVIPSGVPRNMIRYGSWGGEFGLFYCANFGWIEPFGSIGFRGYGKKPSDLFRSTFGVHILSSYPFSLRAALQLDYGLFNGRKDTHPNALLYNTNFRLLNFEGIAYYNFWKGCCINLGGFYHLWGENIGNNGGFFGGISCVF